MIPSAASVIVEEAKNVDVSCVNSQVAPAAKELEIDPNKPEDTESSSPPPLPPLPLPPPPLPLPLPLVGVVAESGTLQPELPLFLQSEIELVMTVVFSVLVFASSHHFLPVLKSP